MVAYIVFTREKMRNLEAYDRCREASRPAAAGHPLEPLALRGKHEILEGATIEGAVTLEFPTIEGAKAYYCSPPIKTLLSIFSWRRLSHVHR
jgi:uncharacterized protein (DUF1330 family)